MSKATWTAEEPASSSPAVDVTLSRPSYRLGSTVVGMIRLACSKDCKSSSLLRESMSSLEVAMTGHCRLDSRWHSSAPPNSGPLSRSSSHNSSKNGGESGNEEEIAASKQKIWDDFPHANNTLCTWATNRVDLLALRERVSGRWEDVKPKPIVLSRKEPRAKDTLVGEERLEEQQLTFTFRVDLPGADAGLPPTLVATSCRYYYAIVLRMDLKGKKETKWIQVPVQILTAEPLFSVDATSFDRPLLQAMAHSSGLPCGALTAIELEQRGGRLTVHHRHSAAHSRHICHRRGQSVHQSQVQSMRVTDPQTGRPVCLLTIMGATLLHPGSRIVIKLDFPTRQKGGKSTTWVPVHQASACIEGEEVVIRLRDGQRTRARAYLLDTAHVAGIDPSCVESVTLPFVLPLSAPYTVATERVEIRIRCLIDICCSVDADAGVKPNEDYRNLRLEIPCQVVHATSAWEEEKIEQDISESPTAALDKLISSRGDHEFDSTDPNSFRVTDIRDELTILSLRLADTCNLRPKTLYCE